MTNLSIELTTYCNAKCAICKRHDDPDVKKYLNKHINLDDLTGFIKKQNPLKMRIVLSGLLGEPLLYNNVSEILDILIDMNFYVKIHTNFDIVNPDVIAKIKRIYENNKLEIWVAVDSLDPERHLIYRGTNLNHILNNLNMLGTAHTGINIRTIIFKHNEQDYAELLDWCTLNKYIPQMTVSCFYTDKLKPPTNQKMIKESNGFNYCVASLFVTVEGLIVPCCHAFNDLKFKHSAKDSIMLYKNKDKLHISNIGDVSEILDNEYIKLYFEQKARFCFLCGQRDRKEDRKENNIKFYSTI